MLELYCSITSMVGVCSNHFQCRNFSAISTYWKLCLCTHCNLLFELDLANDLRMKFLSVIIINTMWSVDTLSQGIKAYISFFSSSSSSSSSFYFFFIFYEQFMYTFLYVKWALSIKKYLEYESRSLIKTHMPVCLFPHTIQST